MSRTNESPLPAKLAVTAKRIVAGVAAVIFNAFSLFLLRQLLRGFERFGFDFVVLLLMAYSVTGAIICWWFALRGHLAESRRHLRLTIRGGWIVGVIGFAVGFIGPIVFTPKSNQGPLLGIFFTGPLGFVFGAVIGWFYGAIQPPSPGKPA